MIFNYKNFLILSICILFSHIAKATDIDKLNITSDNLTIQNDIGTATFSGSVIVVFDNLTLHTSKLIVFYKELNKKREIIKILIPGKLKAIRNCGTEIAIADSGYYDHLTKKLTLDGNVMLQKDEHILTTNKLIYSSSLKQKNTK
jgi:lipopolysaccharide export system protein LptA